MSPLRSALVTSLLCLVSCNAVHDSLEPLASAQAPAPEPLELELDSEVQGLKIRLSEAAAPAPAAGQAAPPSTAEPLDEHSTQALLDRLPALEEEAGDRQPFVVRPDSQPPPRAGATVQLEFPPPQREEAPEADPGGLTVLRHAPEGELSMVPHVSVTFSQPMVAVTSQEEASKIVPLTLTPEPRGQWRWVGTRTLLFEPKTAEGDRAHFPMATEYQVTIPKGSTSALGTALEEELSWSFATPPPTVQRFFPEDGPHQLDPFLFLGFDQQVLPQAILPFVSLKTGFHEVPLQLAGIDEIPEDDWRHRTVQDWPAGRSLLLKPAEPLKPDTWYQLSVAEGAPSAEGPLLTAADQRTDFYTYGPLKVDDQGCVDGLGGCAPDGQLWVSFSNPLDDARFDPASIQVEPEIQNLRIVPQGYSLAIYGDKKPRATTTVTLPASLPDAFGQTLGKAKKLSFKVGSANKQLQGPGKELVVLDPAAPPAFSVYSINHQKLKLRVYEVGPKSYPAVSKWLREARYDQYFKDEPPAKRLAKTTIQVSEYEPDELVETALDLSPWLIEGRGQLLLWVEPTSQPADRWQRSDVLAWVQATEIGLTAFVDQDEVLTWASSLRDGRPLEGVQLQLLGDSKKVTTGPDGLARLGKYEHSTGPHALLARQGDDLALLPERMDWWNEYGSWHELDQGQSLRWFVFDDRQMYRPGERMRVKGWLRRFDGAPGGDLLGYEGSPESLRWTITDAYGNELGTGSAEVGELGGFDLAFEIPDTPALGHAQLRLEAAEGEHAGAAHHHAFQIQEFRRPEFEVSTSLDPRPYILGEHAYVTANAAYYAGGALPDAPVEWHVHWTDGSFTPPGREDYRFGSWSSWWGGLGSWGMGGLGYWGGSSGPQSSERLQGATGPDGSHTIKLDFLALHPPRPMSVTAEATVIDVNRQRWTSSQTLLLHPAALYVGLKSERAFYDKGDEVEIQAIVTDLEGQAIPEVPVQVTMSLLQWGLVDGSWQQQERSPQNCALTSSEEAETCRFTPAEGGSYRISARIEDSEGRPSEAVYELWISGGKNPPQRNVEMEQVLLVADKEQYQVGEVAEIMVQAPFSPAEGVYSLRRNGLMSAERIRIEGPGTTLRVPITEAHIPVVHVELDLVGSAERRDDQGQPLPDKARRAAYASGSVSLSVPPLNRTLKVLAQPRQAAIDPGGETVIDVQLRDAAGQPVPGEVAVVVADESVLALSGYALPDPISIFYATQHAGVSEHHLRQQVVLADPLSALAPAAQPQGSAAANGHFDVTAQLGALGYISDGEALGGLGGKGSGFGAGGGQLFRSTATKALEEDKAMNAVMLMPTTTAAYHRSPAQPIALRQDFSALALFAPHVKTDAQGHAEVPIQLPDSLTRYRVMAVAVAGDKQFGAGESTLTARKALMLRPSPPRFLNFGDRAELPLVVQNQTDEPLSVDLALRMANAGVVESVDLPFAQAETRQAGRRLLVPAHDRREVRFPIAADMAGTARFQVVATAGAHSDAALFDFPVWTPATSEAFATYGELDQGAAVQPVQAPEDVWPQFGGIEVSTSSTALQALTDALLHLVQYPYECSEQLASRVLAVAALRDVLEAFEAEQLPAPAELEAAVGKDLERLARRQHDNGGFSFWGGMPDEPYLTVHVCNALVRAEARGFELPEGLLPAALKYLKRIENHIPWWYSEQARRSIIAYSVYVRHLRGDDDLRRARQLYGHGLDAISLEAQAWILPVLQARGSQAQVRTILRYWENRVSETAGAAQFNWGYSDANDYVLMHSSRRSDGIILDSLVEVAPQHDVIPKLVRGLLGHRVRGAWSTTQENAFVLLAMDRYFRTYESVQPDFAVRVWLGQAFAGEHEFKGYSTERARIDVPMDWLQPGATQDLTLAKQGEGRLYYRVGMRYAPKDLDLEPADHGFTVQRVYEPVDDPEDVVRQEDGSWSMRAGARVRVRLTMVAPGRRSFVALVDPLPAGLEPMNPALAVTGSVPEDPSKSQDGYWWWRGTWYQHQNMRDERVEAFTTYLWDGVFEYSYVATATTPGRFVVPPAKAEEMYDPETFGRSGTDRVWVR